MTLNEDKFWDDFRDGICSVWIETSEEKEQFFHEMENNGICYGDYDKYKVKSPYHCDRDAKAWVKHAPSCGEAFYLNATYATLKADYHVRWGDIVLTGNNVDPVSEEEFLGLIGEAPC